MAASPAAPTRSVADLVPRRPARARRRASRPCSAPARPTTRPRRRACASWSGCPPSSWSGPVTPTRPGAAGSTPWPRPRRRAPRSGRAPTRWRGGGAPRSAACWVRPRAAGQRLSSSATPTKGHTSGSSTGSSAGGQDRVGLLARRAPCRTPRGRSARSPRRSAASSMRSSRSAFVGLEVGQLGLRLPARRRWASSVRVGNTPTSRKPTTTTDTARPSSVRRPGVARHAAPPGRRSTRPGRSLPRRLTAPGPARRRRGTRRPRRGPPRCAAAGCTWRPGRCGPARRS